MFESCCDVTNVPGLYLVLFSCVLSLITWFYIFLHALAGNLDFQRVYLLVIFVCNNKVGVHVGGVLKHDVLCDNIQGLRFQGAIGLYIYVVIRSKI